MNLFHKSAQWECIESNDTWDNCKTVITTYVECAVESFAEDFYGCFTRPNGIKIRARKKGSLEEQVFCVEVVESLIYHARLIK